MPHLQQLLLFLQINRWQLFIRLLQSGLEMRRRMNGGRSLWMGAARTWSMAAGWSVAHDLLDDDVT